MQVIEYKNASEFLEATRELLLENEAANAIILSYAHNQTQGIESAMTTTFYCVVEGDNPLLPAMFTAGIWPLLTDGPDDAARLLARYFFPKIPTMKGVSGPKDASLAFADEWEALTRCNLEINMNSRIYECTAVTRLDWAEGTLRQATMDDIDLVQEWREAFRIEAQVAIPKNVDQVVGQLEDGNINLWITDRPVSTAVMSRGTDNGRTVGAVYTPPEHRNNGYATALTAAITQKILDSGKKHVVLYTDLDNPTSNSIYQQIGYKPISDATVWLFSPALEPTRRRPYS
ncbi:MAG: GNAT family N-acetyltransferase [Dehalococcoidia bacterium]